MSSMSAGGKVRGTGVGEPGRVGRRRDTAEQVSVGLMSATVASVRIEDCLRLAVGELSRAGCKPSVVRLGLALWGVCGGEMSAGGYVVGVATAVRVPFDVHLLLAALYHLISDV